MPDSFDPVQPMLVSTPTARLRRLPLARAGALLVALVAAATAVHAQMDSSMHRMHMMQMSGGGGGAAPAQSGQAAFAAMAQVVRTLEADSTTDWSKVNIEALRQHLIDMDDVVLRSEVKQRAVPGGMTADVTGTGRTVDAIRRMVTAHAPMLEDESGWHATVADIAGGVRLTVTAADTGDARTAARIRGLGFAGLLTVGEHHAMHHLMIARGMGMMHHG